MDRIPVLEDGTAADEPDAGDQPLDDARIGLGMVAQDPFGCLHEAARGNGDQREGAQAGTALRPLPVPADWHGEGIGHGERNEMRHDSETIQWPSFTPAAHAGMRG